MIKVGGMLMTSMASYARSVIVEWCVYKTTWQSLKVLGLTCDLLALFIQQLAKISTDTVCHMGISAIAELLVCTGWPYQVPAWGGQIILKRGMVRVTRPVFNFDACDRIPGMAEARVAKFCVQVEYVRRYDKDDKVPPSGRGQLHVTN